MSKTASRLAALAVFIAASSCALGGIDFGHHWDEYKHLEPAARSVQAGSYLPERYIYPSLCYDLILFSIAAHAAIAPPAATGASLRARLTGLALSRPFKLRVRGLFALLTLLTSLWIYLLVRRWRADRAEAALACALLGLSWEVGYHARWIAPDGLVMQLGALTMLAVIASFDAARRTPWLVLAAAAAGLACAAKYPGGLLLLPVLLAAGERRPGSSSPPRLAAGLALIFALVYLAATPGTVLDLSRFLADVREEMHLYARGHFGYTVAAPGEHLGLSLVYLGLVAFSRYPEIALFFAALTPLGAATLLRRDRRRALIFLSFPVFYLGYFCLQKVMIARNLLVLFPFAAVLAAVGWGEARRRLTRPSYQLLLSGATVVFLLLNLAWLIRAAASIRAPGEDVSGLAAYIDARPETRFALSAGAAAALFALDGAPRANVATRPLGARLAVLFASEVESARWTANRPDYTRAWFGPYEVNFNYYPTWQGRDRLLVMPVHHALPLGVFDAAQ